MRFLFYVKDCVPFHGKSLEERPLGGSETAIIRMAEALDSLGHDVIVITPHPEPPKTKPIYISLANPLPLFQLLRKTKFDAVIFSRAILQIYMPVNAKKRLYWTGDSYDGPLNIGFGDRRFIKLFDGLLVVSEWHRRTLCEETGFPLEKTSVLRNGINLRDYEGFEPKNRKRLIFTSAPPRGLQLLPPIFMALKEKHPDLELHIFGGFNTYSNVWPPRPEAYMWTEYKELLSTMPKLKGCFVHDSLPQRLLAREYMKSGIMTYPNKIPETSCITAMEAQAGGCAIIMSELGGEKETVGDAGILLKETPGTEEYLHKYIETVDRLLTDNELYEKLVARGKERAKSFDWKIRALELLDYLKTHHGLK